jgi:hypothetical protein
MTTAADELEALSDPARMIECRRIPRRQQVRRGVDVRWCAEERLSL